MNSTRHIITGMLQRKHTRDSRMQTKKARRVLRVLLMATVVVDTAVETTVDLRVRML